jgi:hypothetical protein
VLDWISGAYGGTFADMADYLVKNQGYSWAQEGRGEPTEEIEDGGTYHPLDAERYVIGWLNRTGKVGLSGAAKPVPRDVPRRPEFNRRKTGGRVPEVSERR